MSRSAAGRLAVLLLVAGCAGEPAAVGGYVAEGDAALDHDRGPSTADGTPPDRSGVPPPSVSWFDGGRYLGVTTAGSGSCPSVPTSVDWDGEVLRVDLGDRYPEQDVCSADLSPYTVVLDVPAGVVRERETRVDLDGADLVLPPA